MIGGGRGPSVGAVLLLVVAIAVLLFGGGGDGGGRDGGGGAGGGGRDLGVGRTPGGGATGTRVTRVVDGDTVEATVGGELEDIRYIGLDTPESVAPGQPVECFGPQAADYNRRLVEGEAVGLVFDKERRDRYGRLLAYVYLGDEFVNATLVRRGFARTLTITPNDRFAALFARLEQQAGNAGRGLWEAC